MHRPASYWDLHKYRVVRPTTSLYNLAFIYAGEGILELDGDLYELGPGCVFHVNPGRRMDLKSSQEQPLQYFGVHFHQLRIQWEGGDYQATFTDTPLPFQRLLALRGHPVHEDIRTMYECWHVKAAGYEWQTKLGLFQLLNELCNVVITERTLQDSSYRKMERSVRYIRHHYAEPLQRETLAEHADLSVSHYSALFKKVIGISPLQFVEKVRMDQAKSMLTGTSKPISEIAKDVGYSDPLYFTRVFTKVTGMAPRDYRGG